MVQRTGIMDGSKATSQIEGNSFKSMKNKKQAKR